MAVAAALNVNVAANTSDFTAGMDRAGRSLTNLKSIADKVAQQTRTPFDRYKSDLSQLSGAFKRGELDAETYRRAVREVGESYTGAASKAEALRTAGERVFRSLMTPAEAYRAKLAELNKLLASGAITQATFDRGRAAALGVLNAPHVAKRSAAADIATAKGKAVFDSTRTAAERYSIKLAELNGLLKSGSIDQATHARAVALARASYISASSGVKLLTDNTTRLMAVQKGASSVMGKLGAIRFGGGAAIAGLVGGGVAKHSIGLAADFQATSISMEVLMKDAKASKILIEDLYQYAAKTPFQFPEVTAAGKQLLGFGVEAKNIMPTIKNLGELSSGLDIPLGELANVFGRNRNQAHIFSRDINEFTSRGIPIIQQLAKQFGVANSEVMNLVESGEVGFNDLEKAIASMTGKGGQFEGLTERLSASMKGLASTAKDDFNSAMRELGNTLGEKVIPLLSQAAKAANELAQNLSAPEKTDLMKGLNADQASRSKANALNTPAQIRMAIKDNLARQKAALESDAALNKTAGGYMFNPLNYARNSEASRGRLNDLARERSQLENRLRTMRNGDSSQLNPNGRHIDLLNPLAEGVVGGAGKMAKAFGEGAKALDGLLKDRGGQFRALREGFEHLEQGGKLISDLRTQGDVFGMNARQAAIYKAKLDGVPEPLLKIARANAKRISDMEASKRLRDREAEESKDLTNRFQQFEEQTRTPREELDAKLKEIEKVRKGGFGTTAHGKDVLDRAEAAARKDFEAATGQKAPRNSQPEGNQALLRGSSEAFSAIFRAPRAVPNGPEKIAQQQLVEAKRAAKNLDVIAKAFGNAPAIIVGELPV